MKKFWMLYNPKRHSPQYIHQDYDNAMLEAKRLAVKEREPIVILEAIGDVRLKELPTEFYKYGTDEELTVEERDEVLLVTSII